MTTDICKAVGSIGNGNDPAMGLINMRDDEVYEIAKLKDGNCWMLDNLRLGGDSKITLRNTDTNIGDGPWDLPAGATSGFGSYTSPQIVTSYKDNEATNYGAGSAKSGVYYNYCAATAGTICAGADAGGPSATYDICPANWRLPTGGAGGDFRNLCDSYNGAACEDLQFMSANDTSSIQYNLSVTLAGFIAQYNPNIEQRLLDVATDLWSSTSYDADGVYGFSARSNAIWLALKYYRAQGTSLRCLAK